MKKLLLIALLALAFGSSALAQRFLSRDAKIQFNSDTPMEKIEGVNKSGTAVIDTKTGRMEWKVLIKNFIFEKSLMQEHFNENYMESSKYSDATFKGSITNPAAVNFGKDGEYKVTVKGMMTIHGVEKEIEVPGTITVKNGELGVNSNFMVACADYKIDIPKVVRDNIAKEIAVSVVASLKPMKK